MSSRVEPTTKSIQGSGSDRCRHHVVERRCVEQVDKVTEAPDWTAVDHNCRIGWISIASGDLQGPFDPRDYEGELRPRIFRFCECKAKEPILGKLPRCPQIRLHTSLPAPRIGDWHSTEAARRRIKPDA